MNYKDLIDFLGSISTMWLLFLHFLPVINEVLTFIIGILTLVWFVVRIYDRWFSKK